MLTYDLNQRKSQALYEYLYQCIKKDILEGILEAGSRLPSKREFAIHHQISLKTVENTYEQLLTEGYIYSEERRGYFVASLDRDARMRQSRQENHIPFYIPDGDSADKAVFADFVSNQAAIERFPYHTWSKVMREVLSQGGEDLLKAVPFQGVYALREAIAKYLYGFRGMQVSPDQIMIGAGTEYLYSHLIQLLGRNHVYALEDPGYQKIAKIYQSHEVPWEYMPMAENGIQIEQLFQSKVSVVHVSPAHHYPTGIIMPVSQRQMLLEWAESSKERYIIEDDFDSEFRFSHRPIPAIQSIHHNHRVIYMNTFTKTLVPSICISYMVLPRKLAEYNATVRKDYACSVSAFEQYALAEFINGGYFERHIHKMQRYYKAKRDAMLKVFKKSALCNYAVIDEKDAGNHFLMKLHTKLSDTELKWFARENGIRLDCLSEYCEHGKELYAHTIIVNYSDLDEENFGKALEVLLLTVNGTASSRFL